MYDAKMARRMLPIASVVEDYRGKGRSRPTQKLCDWLHRSNDAGLEGRFDRPASTVDAPCRQCCDAVHEASAGTQRAAKSGLGLLSYHLVVVQTLWAWP